MGRDVKDPLEKPVHGQILKRPAARPGGVENDDLVTLRLKKLFTVS
jgi:hypothetical protein